MPMIDELRRARIAQETHPLQKIVDIRGNHLGTGCMRCGMLIPAGLFMGFRIPPCEPIPVQQP